jgi:hypothetical protein
LVEARLRALAGEMLLIFSTQGAHRLETIVSDIEAELMAGLEEADNFPGQH